MELRQPSSLAEVDGGLPLAGGTEVVPLLRDGLVEAETLVDIRAVVPKGVSGTTIGAGTLLAELEADPEIPSALREACRLAASPRIDRLTDFSWAAWRSGRKTRAPRIFGNGGWASGSCQLRPQLDQQIARFHRVTHGDDAT